MQERSKSRSEYIGYVAIQIISLECKIPGEEINRENIREREVSQKVVSALEALRKGQVH